MALVLLMLILQLSTDQGGFLLAALVLQIVVMTAPLAFRPAAVVWLGLSRLLGAVMSRILLGVVFFGLVTPIGVLRRLMGKDPMRRRAFRASNDSVFVTRDHTFVPDDLEKPY
jgi:polyferredoxin